MADIDASIAETQKVLGAIIQKPKLTEGLLKKPPFRFLHDIVTEVKKVSGFPASTILTDFDLDSGNFKDKDSKVAYLNKIIGAVSEAAGTPLQVKPLKIVAGLEPELTNELLQALAKASQGAAPAATPPAEKPRAEPKKERPPPADAPPKEERPKEERAAKPRKEEPALPAAEAERPQRAEGRTRKKEEDREAPAAEAPAPAKAAPPTAERETIAAAADEDRPGRMERPRTALRAPPKQAAGAAMKDTRPTSKQDAQRATAKVIAEGDMQDDEDEDDDGGLSGPAKPAAGRGAPARGVDEGAGHGKLVKQMLKVESEQQEEEAAEGGGGVVLGDSDKDRDRKRMMDEMDKLRDSIQTLCKSTNPLARSMDYLQEDLDNMAKELDFWMKDRDDQTARLEDEERKTEQDVDKLYSELQGVEESIKEEELRIKDLKASVLENDKTVKNMLASIVRTNTNR